MGRRVRSLYGAGPGHLLAMAGCFTVAGYSAVRLLGDRPVGTAVWFAGSAVLHDLVVLPLYVVADGALTALWRRHPAVRGRSWLGYVRWPAAISVLLLVVFSPEIFRRDRPYPGASGLSSRGYLGHWLIVVGILWGLSAVVFLSRVVIDRGRPR